MALTIFFAFSFISCNGKIVYQLRLFSEQLVPPQGKTNRLDKIKMLYSRHTFLYMTISAPINVHPTKASDA